MNRVLVLSAVVLLALAPSAMAQPTTINVEGKMSNGGFVNAVCSISKTGQITGTGVLYGQNPGTGATYKYPFTISKGTTAQGKLVLTGKLAAGPPVTLTASVPNGPLVFSYVVNGNTYSLTGQGTVSVK